MRVHSSDCMTAKPHSKCKGTCSLSSYCKIPAPFFDVKKHQPFQSSTTIYQMPHNREDTNSWTLCRWRLFHYSRYPWFSKSMKCQVNSQSQIQFCNAELTVKLKMGFNVRLRCKFKSTFRIKSKCTMQDQIQLSVQSWLFWMSEAKSRLYCFSASRVKHWFGSGWLILLRYR